MLSIREFLPQEWRVYRDLRLGALRDAPGAFGSTLAREEPFTDAEWMQRLANGVSSPMDRPLIAERDGRPVGLCWTRIDQNDTGTAWLYQVWVHPDGRRQGVAQGLLEAAMQWAREAGAQRMMLTVSVAYDSPMRLYRRAGFAAVGLPGPLREGSELLQQAMECDLTRR